MTREREASDGRAGDRPKRATPAGVRQSGAAAVLALQRGHGNRAVTAMLGTASRRMIARGSAEDEKAWDVAVAGNAWATAAELVDRLGNDQLAAKIATLTEDQVAELDAAITSRHGRRGARRVFNRLNFLMDKVVPAVQETAADPVQISHPGTRAPDTGGGVSVHTGAKLKFGQAELEEAFSIAYEGPLAAASRWVQFVWRELEATYPGNAVSERVRATYESGGRTHRYSAPDAPDVQVDASSEVSPHYEARGAQARTERSTTIFDQPEANEFEAHKLFSGARPATRVVERAHFTSYLLQGPKVVHRIELEVEWTYAGPQAAPKRVQRQVAGRATPGLDPPHREVLVRDYPWFEAELEPFPWIQSLLDAGPPPERLYPSLV